MFFKLVFLFVAVPLLELYLLLEIGRATDSALVPLALVVLTAVIGAALVKQQGRKAFLRIKEEMSAGKIPGDALIDALLILIAGVVFLTPGILSDIAGITLVFPMTRAIYRKQLKKWFKNKVASGQFVVTNIHELHVREAQDVRVQED